MSPTSRRTGRPVKPKAKATAKSAKKKAAPARKKSVRMRAAAKPVKKDRIVREKKTTAKPKTTKAQAVPVKKKPAAAAVQERKKTRPAEKAKLDKSKLAKAAVAKSASKAPLAPEKRPVLRKRKPSGPSPLAAVLREDDPLLEPDALEPEVFDPEASLIEPDEIGLEIEPEVLLPAEDLPIEGLDIPLELWDPELLDVNRPPPAPKPPKPKPAKADKRQQQCQNCGATFTWLSVDGLCFTCLKRRVAQRRREDESYSGFTAEAEDDDES